MIERYSRPEMKRVWSEENKFQKWLRVEVAVCLAWAELGAIPREAADKIARDARFDLKRIEEHFEETHHDMTAFLRAVGDSLGEEGRFVHFGLTSSDVIDTALALQFLEAADLLERDLGELLGVLEARAREHQGTLMMGRTHGVHAEPTTFGLKLALWAQEVKRHRQRLVEARKVIGVGKISGTVGTYATVPPEVEELACRRLGLEPDPISSQIVQRDRHAQFITTLALIGSSLEKFATEVRSLQRTEVLEVEEPFEPGQTGSSAMPHKRNPELSERVCGLARLLRGFSLTALENIALWHERDISHSSAERIIFPDSSLALDYMLAIFTYVMKGLQVYPQRMKENLERTQGVIFSQRVLLALIEKGLDRQKAYRIVQENAMRAWKEGRPFLELLKGDRRVKLSSQELEALFDYGYYTRHVGQIFQRLGLAGTPARALTVAPLSTLLKADLPLHLFHRGKVRDNYDLGDRLLMVASDRISAFDVVLPNGIPNKGKVLTQLSAFWFEKTSHIIPNHLIALLQAQEQLKRLVPGKKLPLYLLGRSMLVKKAERLPVECVVRGYISGSAWAEYSRDGKVTGQALPPGLKESERLPQPLFTPTTKEERGHDRPITRQEVSRTLGPALAREVEEKSLALYSFAHQYALERGIIIADAKMEFGLLGGELILIDELFTPDSSRFWDKSRYSPGGPQPSYDKQPVRDWLTSSGWDQEPPAPALPDWLIRETSERYREVYKKLTGKELI